jgi:rSAM/selenodomain-associated transferase 1
VERLDRRRLVHPLGHREEPAAPGDESGRTGTGDMSRPGIDCGREEIRGAVVVIAKAPREGFVKTRLTGAYPARDVVQLSECMLRDTLALVQTLSRVHVAVMCPSEDVADIEARLPAGVHVVGQCGNGLAAALVSAFEHFVPDFRRVVAVDSDSPHLPLEIFHSAFELLETNEVVVGPTEDGGYYLVGASAMHPPLFHPAPLGTGNARDALLENARALGLSVAFTEAWYDVDLPADLRRLAAELRIEPARAPRTAALLASWRPDSDAHDDKRAG